ncbi:phosphocarrier protein HPr [Candidatus Mycoplasma haematolamae str. Purdue]|uniref:Phosphocarrier protein HPr n=1 Tax=Mycoplasma haematolamae (strain Purdue) TaxID=1212765 RepID=I7CJQ2_MYCHA|nr:HPr family phosphocarrier protein [Candidatus Mycoplasma haematolamae]AFO52089.1 phosphocarrier protein HPr [Candidatus Mycoplasma haematolamae str. Purdue]
MKIVDYKIQDPNGLHARPTTKLIQSISKYKSKVIMKYEGKTANAKSIINLMALGVGGGAEVVFEIEGEDEEELSSRLKDILAEHGI